MAAHARLKNEFKEDKKCHNLMSWLIYVIMQFEHCCFTIQNAEGMANSVDPDLTASQGLHCFLNAI